MSGPECSRPGGRHRQAVIYGADPALITPVQEFKRSYHRLMRRLAATGATVVVANIPDVTVTPYLTSAEDVAAIIGLPLALVGPALGIGAGDFVTPDAFALIPAILADPASGPLPDGAVLDAREVATIRSAIQQFNAIIAREADAAGAALVDIHGLLDQATRHGILVEDRRLKPPTSSAGSSRSTGSTRPTPATRSSPTSSSRRSTGDSMRASRWSTSMRS
jgi:hypothetical protein